MVFIRHHTSAREVDEEEFFYSRETGGTIVSSALKMMQEIMAERYPTHEWNIYAAQASDGDNWNDDSPVCRDILLKQIMPFVQYYTYVEITPREHQALWFEYERVREAFDSFAQQQIVSASDIYPVFPRAVPEEARRMSKRQPIATGSEWTFELIQQYDREISRIAERYAPGYLSEPDRGDHRRADDGRLRLGGHADRL